MRAIWSGAIGFGLVNIPVKLFSAIEPSELSLDMLDKKDHANIKYQRINANTGKEVPWGNIVKGYKLEDRYVVLSEEDFQRASPEKNKIIEINEFVEEQEIDSIYYETPYYLQPDKSGVKAYALLREALKKKSYEPDIITMSGVTDCYQPGEREFKLTRQCLQVMAEFRNPGAIITKNRLVTRDIDVMSEMAA